MLFWFRLRHAPVGAASEGDGQERSNSDRDPASDLHFVLPLLDASSPPMGDTPTLSGDTHLAHKGDVSLRGLL
jgi:hypothetical protein